MSLPQGSLRPIPPTPPLPTDKVIACALADCPNTFRITDSFGFVLSMMKRGDDPRLAGFQCPDPRELAAGNLEAQHFGCCPEHALIITFLCARDHVIPLHFAEVAALAQADADRISAAAAPDPTKGA